MKILFIQDTDWINRNIGIQNHLIERLVLRGHEVRVVDYQILWREGKKSKLWSKKKVFQGYRLNKDARHLVIRPGILKIPYLDYISMFFSYWKEIKNQILSFKPNIIMGDGIITPYIAFNLAQKFKIKKVYYCIDIDYKLIPNKILHPIGKIFEKHNITLADFVISNSAILREYTIQMGAKPERTALIRSGIDLTFFSKNIKTPFK